MTIILLLALGSILPAFAVDYLRPNDFDEGSWSKTIDYLEYVDVYASIHGKPRPPAGAHAYLYMNYVNQSGVQMLYAGLSNITIGLGALSVTLPIQTLMMHYKTQDNSRDVVTASSYIMLLAYNESEPTIHSDSPDRNDTLFASFSLGFDLSSLISTDAPALNSRTKTIALTHPEENRWHWGMTYTNLTAIWWRIWIDPTNATYQSVPAAISVYEELTFTYDLIFDLENNTAQIISNYVIGRMTDLWVVDTWWWFIPVIVHYNSTGCYRLNHSQYSNETIYQFLNDHDISMSMVFFQASALLDHVTESEVEGETIGDNEVMVSNHTIVTNSEDGERICDVDFGSKNNYTLYNSTSNISSEYSAVTRIAHRGGFASNPIFNIHTFLMRYIPAVLVHMDPSLYEQAKNHLLNMTYADYFYIISYPTYDGYRIEHDPLYTAYFAAIPETSPGLGGIIGFLFLFAIFTCIVVVIVVVIRRRGSNT
ncbi:MAG: hypothetical protein PVH12_02705 [Candidatus Bathyarchaeota archaeon]